jgi:hypothetical protein
MDTHRVTRKERVARSCTSGEVGAVRGGGEERGRARLLLLLLTVVPLLSHRLLAVLLELLAFGAQVGLPFLLVAARRRHGGGGAFGKSGEDRGR